jgi:hypothetical protein
LSLSHSDTRQKTYTSVKGHEGEVSREVVVNEAGDFVGKSAKQKTLAMDSSSATMLGPIVALYAGPWNGGALLKSGRIGGFACAIGYWMARD